MADMKRLNPPVKSALMKILTESIGNNPTGTPKEESQSDENLMLDSIGCTANVIMCDFGQRKLTVANAGDSRAVMGRAGKAVALSFDHKPENQVEIDRITKAGSVITEGRVDGNLNLTRALGDLKYKRKEGLTPEECPITANPDTYEYEFDTECDFILMGCDGVWEQKSNEEMVAWVYERLNAKKDHKDIISELLHECLSPDHTQTSKHRT